MLAKGSGMSNNVAEYAGVLHILKYLSSRPPGRVDDPWRFQPGDQTTQREMANQEGILPRNRHRSQRVCLLT